MSSVSNEDIKAQREDRASKEYGNIQIQEQLRTLALCLLVTSTCALGASGIGLDNCLAFVITLTPLHLKFPHLQL